MASVTMDGRDVTGDDLIWGDRKVTSQNEALAAGNRVSAVFSFKNGVRAFFESGRLGGYSLEFTGTHGRISHSQRGPGSPWQIWKLEHSPAEWIPIDVPEAEIEPYPVATELIRCLEEEDEHASSGHHGRAVLELIMAIYESQIQGGKVSIPLARREHPLKQIQSGEIRQLSKAESLALGEHGLKG